MNNIAIVFWSGTGNTEQMAEALNEACVLEGAKSKLLSPSEFAESDISLFDSYAFGCPAMGDEALEEYEFQPMWDKFLPHIANKKIALFGSYSWNDGEWMKKWAEECKNNNASLVCEALPCYNAPDADCFDKLKAMAKALNN